MQRIAAVLSVIVFSLLLATPASAAKESGPVTCADGTTSPHGGKGACSGHGGIKKAEASTKKPAKETKEKETKAKTKAKEKEKETKAKATKAKEKETRKKETKKKASPSETPAAITAPAAAPATATPAKREASESKSRANTDPSGATARCKDGTYSHAQTHQGACSRHGGVAEWLDGSGNR